MSRALALYRCRCLYFRHAQLTNGTASGGVPPTEVLEEVLDRIESAAGDLANLVGPEELDAWNAPTVARLAEAHTRIRQLTGRLDGVRYTMLPRIERDGSWRAGGMSRTFTSWLRLREGVLRQRRART